MIDTVRLLIYNLIMLLVLLTINEDEREECGFLIVRLAKGDETALNLIYNKFGSRLFSVAVGIMRQKENAEDALQKAFMRIVDYAKTFKAGTNGYAWMCTVVRNTSLNMLKKERIYQCAEIDTCVQLCAGVSVSRDAENSILVEKAFKLLTYPEKTAIWLKYYNDMTIRDIAFEMNLPKSTVSDIIARAELKMRTIIGGQISE